MENITPNFRKENKWFLVPPDWKDDVDRSLLNVLSLNRKFIKNLERQVRGMSITPPEKFLNNLVSSWYNHNSFFSSLYPFLISLPQDGSITQLQANSIQKILDDMGLVDKITLLHSLTIKPLLERNQDIGFMPFNSFYVDYPLDHHDLVCGKISLGEIIQKYHGGSKELFEQRKNKGILSNVFSGEVSCEEMESLRKLKEKMFLSALYDFFIDKPDSVKSLVRISTIDNFDEYRFLYNLEGIEGFYLRDYLLRNGLLENTNLGGESQLNYFTSLKVKMNKATQQPRMDFGRLPFYVQSTGVSCASTCAMMVSNLFYKEAVSKEREDEFHSLMKSDFLDGCPFSKIADVLAGLYPSLKVNLYHTDSNLFNEQMVGSLFGGGGILAVREYRDYAKQAERKGVSINIQRDLVGAIQETLGHGGVYMAATNLGSGILHSELVVGISGTKFQVYNPLNGFQTPIEISEFRRRIVTPIGEWGVAFANKSPEDSSDYISSVDWFRGKEEELKYKGIILNN